MHPEENIWRYTASALYATPADMNGKYFSGAMIWGMNDIGKNDREHSVLLEGTEQLPKQAIYGRYEFVQKSSEELDLEETYGNKLFNIHTITLGTNRKLFTLGPIDLLLGAQLSLNLPPSSLQNLYGNAPMGGQVYLQIRPGLSKM